MSTPDAPFEEPWQAQLFALSVALNERGLFTWSEWTEFFGPRVQRAEAADYWTIWSDALIALLGHKGLAETQEIAELTARWQAAARATPHGRPIMLDAATR